jgi:hypothetical protein
MENMRADTGVDAAAVYIGGGNARRGHHHLVVQALTAPGEEDTERFVNGRGNFVDSPHCAGKYKQLQIPLGDHVVAEISVRCGEGCSCGRHREALLPCAEYPPECLFLPGIIFLITPKHGEPVLPFSLRHQVAELKRLTSNRLKRDV